MVSNALLLLVGVPEDYRLGGPTFQRLHQAHPRVQVRIVHDQVGRLPGGLEWRVTDDDADPGFFTRIVAHRTVYFRKNKEITESLRPGSLRLVPADKYREAWAQDYAAMRETMFFGEAPGFGEILHAVGAFEERLNRAFG